MAPIIPIVFSSGYDIRLWGIEKLHPFDRCKYGHVFQHLAEAGILDGKNHAVTQQATQEDLLEVHSAAYLKSLRKPGIVARIAEVAALRFVPGFLLQAKLLRR
jgi:histone deacetylase 11